MLLRIQACLPDARQVLNPISCPAGYRGLLKNIYESDPKLQPEHISADARGWPPQQLGADSGGLLGKVISDSHRPPCPHPALSFVRDSADVTGRGEAGSTSTLETSEDVPRPIQSPQWLHGKPFVLGPSPGLGVQGPGMKDPFQLDKNALRPHQVQGTALSPGRDGGQWCQGRRAPVAPSTEPLASHCTDPTAGIFAAIVPARRPLSPSRGSHGGPNGHTFAFCSG